MKSLIIPFILTLLLLGACRTYNDPKMYHSYEPKALSVEAGDNYVIRVQGRGHTRDAAVADAQINAVKQVIFKDIQVTYGDHRTLQRLINNPLVEESHSEFFCKFFSSNGAYTRFVSPEKNSREFYSLPDTDIKAVLMNVKVNRKELRDYLADMGVIE